MKIKTLLISLFFTITTIATAHAATVTLKDDRLLVGEIINQTSQVLVMEVNGIEMTVPTDMIKSINFSTVTTKPVDTPEKIVAQKTVTGPINLPVGTPLRIKMDESINSRQHKKGQRFTAKLEANLMSRDTIVAPKGSIVHGVLEQVKTGGRIAGSAEMSIVLTDILINDNLVAISTFTLDGKGQNAARDTLGKTARFAAIGGLIDGSDGAKTGAKVGAGAALLTRNNDIQVEKDALLDFTLSRPLQII